MQSIPPESSATVRTSPTFSGWPRAVRRSAMMFVLFGSLSSLCGCSQFVLLSYLIHGPPTVEPDFDAETGKSMSSPNTTVVVVCYAPTELQWKFPQIDNMVATHVAFQLGQHHIKVIHPDQVRAWIDQNKNWEKAEEVGRAFKATYVIEIELADFSLYEGTSTTLYRGRTEAYINVVEMDEEGYGDRIFSKELFFEFPTRVPRSSYDQTLTSFQREYLSRLSERIGFLFYERFNGDMISWAN